MFRLTLSLIIFSFLGYNSIKGQNLNGSKKIIIYSQNSDILLPMIQNELSKLNFHDLEKGIDSTYKYFDKVNNLNEYLSNIEVQFKVNGLYEVTNVNNDGTTINYSESEKLFLDSINSRIKENDYFLYIRSNVIGSNIEFQFHLIKPKEITNSVPLSLIENRSKIVNFIISVDKDDESIIIRNNLKKLFEGSNTIPKSRLFMDGNEIFDGDRIEVPIGTTIKLDGRFATDNDDDEITYLWKNIKSDFELSPRYIFRENSGIQEITISEPDYYYAIEFSIYDKVNESKPIKLVIIPIFSPEFGYEYLDTIVSHITYVSLFNMLKHSNTVYLEILDVSSVFDVNSVLTTKPIIDSRLNEIKDTISHVIEKNFGSPTLQFDDTKYIYGKNQTYFIYPHHPKTGYFGKPAKYNVTRLFRSPLNLGVNYNLINYTSTQDENEILHYSTFEVGFYLKRQFELNFSIPLNTQTISVSDTLETLTYSSIGFRFYPILFPERLPDTQYNYLQFNLGFKKKDKLIDDSIVLGVELGIGRRLFNKQGFPLSIVFTSAFEKSLQFSHRNPFRLSFGLRYNLDGD